MISAEAMDKLYPIERDVKGNGDQMLEDLSQYSNYQARNYVIGFVGKKLGLKPNPSPVSDSWIRLRGKGKLFEPDDCLTNMCEQVDKKFDEFHSSGVRVCF